MACRNPECCKGLVPGVVIVGKGNARAPILGQTMRWGWVRCLACSGNEDDVKAGAKYKSIQRSAEEIAQRADLANTKAPYKAQPKKAPNLEELKAKLAGASIQPAPVAQAQTNNDQLLKLFEQISQLNTTVMKLNNQISDLLEENRTLRQKLDNSLLTSVPNGAIAADQR